MADALRLHVEPTQIDIKPGGETVSITARVYNATRIVDEFHVAVIGTGQWLDAQSARVRLFPDTDGSVEVEVSIPKDRLVTAGRRMVGVKATSVSNPEVTGTERVEINVVEVVAGESIKVDPSVVHGGQDAELVVSVRNGGDTGLEIVLGGGGPERGGAFAFQPPAVAVPPGGGGWARLRVSAKRPLSGEDRNRQLVVRAEGGHAQLVGSATFIQRPAITRFRLYLLRVLVTLLGAGLMILGAFLDWAGQVAGTAFTIPAFLHIALGQKGAPPSIGNPVAFFVSCGFAVIVLAAVAALGILTPRGRLTKLGGAIALLLLIGFIVEMSSHDLGPGPFVSLFVSVVALAAGFMGTSKRR